MSVILDALRRRRAPQGGSPSSPAVRPVPAGLGLTPASDIVARRLPWMGLIGVVALAVSLGVWAAFRLTSGAGVHPLPAPAVIPQPVPSPPLVAPVPQSTPPAVPDRQVARRNAVPPATSNVDVRTPDAERRTPDVEPRTAEVEPSIPVSTSRPDHFDQALRYQNGGDFERAREHYLAALAEDELNAEARNNLGLLYYSRAMTEDAIDQLSHAILINPRNLNARGNLAVVLMSAGRLAEARAELRAALDVAPGNVDLMVNMALVEKADRHVERATEILVHAIGISPEHAVAHYNLAVLYEERDWPALASNHYNAFLRYAGPEHASRIRDVQRQLRLLGPRLQPAN